MSYRSEPRASEHCPGKCFGRASARQIVSVPVLFALLMLGTTAATIATSLPDEKSPREVVQQLCRLDADGGRFTERGWYRATQFFVRPEPMPSALSLVVMKGDFSIGPAKVHGTEAEVGAEYLVLGRIDSTLRFVRADDSPEPTKWRYFYTLILSDVHSDFKEDRQTLREVHGPLEWRIKDFQAQPVVSVVAAIRYVEAKRSSPNPMIRRNAARTLAELSNSQ